ncbi:MAG: signal peptidase I, partial [Acutalibacter sp.]|nr:signal peptidase I [Acutalibacter sp.]
ARVITVDGSSMEPTYYDGDRVLVTSLAGQAEKGDVVIIVHALEDTIIKRVVATEGQVVDFDPVQGELTVDGTPVKGEEFGIENGITFVPDRPGMVMEFPQQVPEGCVFVLGDNRGASQDSRYLSVGMVDRRNILGRVVLNLFPFSKAGLPA